MAANRYLQTGLSRPDGVAISDAAGSWTYRDLAARVASVTAALEARGAIFGQRIGLFADVSKEYAAAMLGVMQAGAIAVPISIQAPQREIAYIIEDAGLTAAVGSEAFRSRFVESKPPDSQVEFIARSELLSVAAADQLPARSPEDAALMLYTSGTTGQPKGMIHTHDSLTSQVSVLHDAWGWSPDDRLLHVLPLHHIHGLVNGLLGGLWAGGSISFARFDPASTWETFARREASVFYAVPTIYFQLVEAWHKQDEITQSRWREGARSLRLAVCGSAALPAPLWQRWRDITGQALLERYGMTEIGMALSNPYEGERRAGTVGQPLHGTEIRLVTEEGHDALAGEAGEIWVKGRSVFREYWNRPDATRESFRDGYFLTGDIAEMQDGYVRILGRASIDIIKSAAYKLSALEIEEVLGGHPDVAEVAVIGVPDEEWGEIVTACIVPRDDATPTLEDLRAWCADKLAPYKQPRRLHSFDSLPRNAIGKVLKPALQEQLANEAKAE